MMPLRLTPFRCTEYWYHPHPLITHLLYIQLPNRYSRRTISLSNGKYMTGMNMLATDPSEMMAGFNHFEGNVYEIAWLKSVIDQH